MENKNPGETRTIDMTILDNGQLLTDWSDRQINNLICAICQDCPGWDKPNHKIDCVTASRFCG